MGSADLLSGFTFIPVMIGMFGIAEIFRNVLMEESKIEKIVVQTKHIFRGMGGLIKQLRNVLVS